jgi:hypothetical protein
VGDTVADDSACLQAALDAAFAPKGPGFLLAPPGTYKVSSILRVASLEGQRGDLMPGVRQPLVMIGCHGSGDAVAKGAGLARIGFDGAGVRFGSDWKSSNLPRLSEYRMWVDQLGRLRLKKGMPTSDGDDAPVDA